MADLTGELKSIGKRGSDQQNEHQSKKSKEESPTTLLDLNMDAYDLIFNSLERVSDKLNLAMAHPQLAEAFQIHGRPKYKNINILYFTEEDLSTIKCMCGQDFQLMKMVDSQCGSDKVKCLPDNCTIANRLNIVIIDCDYKGIGALPFRRLEISFVDNHVIFKLLKSCMNLKKIVLVTTDEFCKNTIISELNFVSTIWPEKFRLTPDKDYSARIVRKHKNFIDDLYTSSFKSKGCNIMNTRRIERKEYDFLERQSDKNKHF